MTGILSMFKYNLCVWFIIAMYERIQRGHSLVCHDNPKEQVVSYTQTFLTKEEKGWCGPVGFGCGTSTRVVTRTSYRMEKPPRSYFCCSGWTGDIGKDCPIATCSSGCNGGGKCVSPNKCQCFDGFSPPKCRNCRSGLFGDGCGFQCHCRKSTHCRRDGSCAHGCDPAWTGSNCSVALPYLRKPPTVVTKTATTVTLNIIWLASEDLGSGPIIAQKVYFKDIFHNSFTEVALTHNAIYTIRNLMPNTSVTYYARHARKFDGIVIYGPNSPHGSTNTTCSEPLDIPTQKLLSRTETEAVIKVQKVNNDPSRIQCDKVLYYQVRCRSTNNIPSDTNGNSNTTNTDDNAVYNVHNTINVTDIRIVIPGLEKCSKYLVDARVVNSAKYASGWSQPVMIWPVKEEPLDIPSPKLLSRKETRVVVGLQEVNVNSSRIECDKILYYQVRWRSPNEITNDTNTNGSNTTDIDDTTVNVYSSIDVTDIRIVITGLEKCSEYLVDARVVNSAKYASAWSHPVMIWPVKEVSYVPENVSVTASSLISARWSSPEDKQCFDVLYHVVLKFSNTTISVTTNATQVDFLQVTLQPNLEYKIQVATILGDMVGNYSEEIIVMVDAFTNDVNGERSNEWLTYMGFLIVFILCFTLFLVIFIYKKNRSKRYVIDTNGVKNANQLLEIQNFTYDNSIMGQHIYTEMKWSNMKSPDLPKCTAVTDTVNEDVVEDAKMNMNIQDSNRERLPCKKDIYEDIKRSNTSSQDTPKYAAAVDSVGGGSQKQHPCEQHIHNVVKRRCEEKAILSNGRAVTCEASNDNEFEGVAKLFELLKKDDAGYIGLLPTEENVYAELKMPEMNIDEDDYIDMDI